MTITPGNSTGAGAGIPGRFIPTGAVTPPPTPAGPGPTPNLGPTAQPLNNRVVPPTNGTLVYSPDCRILIAHNGKQFDISADIVRGTVIRKENAASTLIWECHNKQLRYTNNAIGAGGSTLFSRMDRVTCYMKRGGDWIQVFSGYLDSVPYYQLYPAIVSFKATCTLKRLLCYWWNPGLQDSIWLMTQQQYSPPPGPTNTPDPSNPNSKFGDTGLSQLLYNILTKVGHWDPSTVHIQRFPSGFMDLLNAQMKQQKTAQQAGEYFRQLIEGTSKDNPTPAQTAGYNSGAGLPGPINPAGGTTFYVSQIVQACDACGMGPNTTNIKLSSGLSQAATAGEGARDQATRTDAQQTQQVAQNYKTAMTSQDAAIIGVAVAMVETGGGNQIVNYANAGNQESLNLPHDAVGHDGSSVGIFQQTDGGAWGTTQERMNPRQAATMFFNALQKYQWQNMDPGVAGWDVQRAADQAGYEGKVDAAIPLATQYVQQYRNSTAAPGSAATSAVSSSLPVQQATSLAPVLGSNPSVQNALNNPTSSPSVILTSGPGGGGPGGGGAPKAPSNLPYDSEGAINFCYAQIGKPYVWGGTGPAGYDCVAENVLITTARGDIPVQDVTDADYVLTRKGFRRVIRAWKVRDNAELAEVKVNGRVLRGTPEHRVWTENRGWVALKDVTRCDTLVSCRRAMSPSDVRTSSSRDTPTLAIPTLCDLPTGRTSSGQVRRFTVPFMSITSVQSQTDMKSTTLTTTRSTTIPSISNASRCQIIAGKVRHTGDCIRISARNVDKNFRLSAPHSVNADFAVFSTSGSITTTAVRQRRSVYDLWVDGVHEFFANGVLVHNCSGLMQAAFHSIGLEIGRDTTTQAGKGQRISGANAARGDTIQPESTHTTMWLGDGSIIEASTPGVPIHRVKASFSPSSAYGVFRFCSNGGPNPSAPFNANAGSGGNTPLAAPATVLASEGSVNGAASGGSSEPIAMNLFTYQFDPSQFISETAAMFGMFNGQKDFINAQPLMQAVAAVCGGSLRSFASAPNGDFIAYYPDFFGMDGKPAVFILEDVELKDLTLNFSDDSLATHVYVNGAVSMIGEMDATLGWLQTLGYATVENTELYERMRQVAPGDLETMTGKQLMARFGVRPLQIEYSLTSVAEMEFLLAVRMFMEKWSAQYQSSISMTFMPDLFPGMRVICQGHAVAFYVNEVTHQFDFEQGFHTTAVVSSPSNPNVKNLWTNPLPSDGPPPAQTVATPGMPGAPTPTVVST